MRSVPVIVDSVKYVALRAPLVLPGPAPDFGAGAALPLVLLQVTVSEGALNYHTRIKLYVEGSPSEWIAGAIVCLYDRDRISRDDHIGTNVTDSYGEAVFHFTADQYLDVDDRIGGSLPELYVNVYDTDGECVLSTRAQAAPNAVPDLIRIPIDRETARRHRLI